MAERGAPKSDQSARKYGFYSRVLDEVEKADFEEASQLEGIDQEIALLRVKFRDLVENQPDRIDLHFQATEVALPLGIGVGMKVAGK
jgi:hypothetical protein